MSWILFGIYIVLALLNLYCSYKNKHNSLLICVTVVLIFFLMNGKTNVQPVDGVYLDHFFYERDYNNFVTLDFDDFKVYPLFFVSEYLGHVFDLTYIEWWVVMSAIITWIVVHTIRKFNYESHFSVFIVMFFCICFYASLKQLSGFCFFFLAISYIVREERKAFFKFFLNLIIARGFHVMFIPFFSFAMLKQKMINLRGFFIILLSMFVVIALFLKSWILGIYGELIINIFEGTSRVVLADGATNYGFLIPVILHLTSLVYSYCYANYIKDKDSELTLVAQNMLKLHYISVVFYPLFLAGVTYTRLITNLALVTLIMSSSGLRKLGYSHKKKMFFLSFFECLMFGLYFYGPCNFWNYALVPFFTIYIF